MAAGFFLIAAHSSGVSQSIHTLSLGLGVAGNNIREQPNTTRLLRSPNQGRAQSEIYQNGALV